MSEIGKQFHHERVALDLLPGQFQDSTNLRALVSALVGTDATVQETEDVLWDLYSMRWLWIAEGAQLDGIGQIFGEPRGGLSDDDYRTRLYATIQTNISQGEPERVIAAAIVATVPTELEYKEKYPATVYIYAHVLTALDSLYLVERTVPAGVYLALVASLSSDPFVFGADRDASGTEFGAAPAYGSGWGESGVGNETIGGNFAELFIGG